MNYSLSAQESKGLLVWDKAAIFKRCRDKQDRVQMLVGMFLEDMPDNFHLLYDAVANKDFSAIQRLAHTVKGVAANLGGDLLSHSASSLEQSAVNGDLNLCECYMEQAQHHFFTLSEELKKFTDEI